jgi:homoserine kinase type II
MLWESVDARDALEKRFGFASAAATADWVSHIVGVSWGIAVDQCDRVVVSAWNAMAWITAGERRLIAKWSVLPHLFARLKDAALVATWLQASGIPTAAPIPAIDGRALVEVRNEARGRLRSRLALPGSRFLVGVLPVLDGQLLDVEDTNQVADAGRMLAAVHQALAAYPDPVDGRRPSGGEQLIHNDFRSSNVLHNGIKVTAVLDLEEIKYDSRVADLAKAAVLLGCRYRDWAPTTTEVRAIFLDAYSSQLPVTRGQRSELEARITAALSEKGWA